ncbi:chromate transporter [Arcticibacter tournemirensis]|uniref:Chromate transporter n=1 Tax=Arcticibacter tournemirensis TaxID=699437 RepID=A0A5M9GU83_9SPHI|nr:chromate transporter [Arcticibacter tournemirensis]KAA8478262.1 chromate transporter [Arcticibacter tournemirensis]TQM50710.1 chromate transporter [Arcticibacter tournemirensis]
MGNKKYTLKELTLYFLKLGTWGFGGPVALIGYMHRDLVEQKQWLTEQEYKEGLALAQLAPGPLAAQLGIYIGFVHYGLGGATLTGLAFVLPSFVMVVLLGMVYQLYSGLAWVRDVFYGVAPAVIGIITISAYKLTVKSLGKLKMNEIKVNWLLWLFYLLAIVITIITQQEQILLFIGCGLLYMIIKAPPAGLRKNRVLPVVLLTNLSFWNYSKDTLAEIGLFFLKAGTFVFGSGLAIVPFLHAGVVIERNWLTENQFLDAVAVAMITPGPVVITVGFIGYLVNGFPGAVVAALATFVPCFLFTVILAPSFKKIAANASVKAFVDGITAAVIGALVGSVVIIASRSVVDLPTALIAVATGSALVYIKKLQEVQLIAVAAILGILIKSI